MQESVASLFFSTFSLYFFLDLICRKSSHLATGLYNHIPLCVSGFHCIVTWYSVFPLKILLNSQLQLFVYIWQNYGEVWRSRYFPTMELFPWPPLAASHQRLAAGCQLPAASCYRPPPDATSHWPQAAASRRLAGQPTPHPR